MWTEQAHIVSIDWSLALRLVEKPIVIAIEIDFDCPINCNEFEQNGFQFHTNYKNKNRGFHGKSLDLDWIEWIHNVQLLPVFFFISSNTKDNFCDGHKKK